MIQKISHNQLPFVPKYGQILYISSGSHKRTNAYVSKHFDWLHWIFEGEKLEFCFFPLFIEQSLAYFAPHQSATKRQAKAYELYQYLCYLARHTYSSVLAH